MNKRDPVAFARGVMALDGNSLYDTLEQVIGLYQEFIDIHGYDRNRAKHAAICDVIDGLGATVELADAGEL